MTDEQAAMEAFCRDAFPRLVGALALYCGDVHVAEELAQEAVLRACCRWPHVSQLESPGGWAYRVGVNLASNRFRRTRAERRANDRLSHEQVATKSEVDKVADVMAVRDALAGLTDAQREAVILRFYWGMDSVEAAQVLGLTPEAVRGRWHRAAAVLREALDAPHEQEQEVADV